MAVNLVKRGTKVNLTKEFGVKRVRVEFWWNANRFDTGPKHDLDISAFVLQENGKCREDADAVVSFGTDERGRSLATHPSGGVKHSGDERDGGKEGADEIIWVDFEKLRQNAPHAKDVDFIATTNDGVTFGQVSGAQIKIFNEDTNQQILPTYDLEEDFSNETAVKVIRFYVKDDEWRFSAEAVGYAQGLPAFVEQYGLQVGESNI